MTRGLIKTLVQNLTKNPDKVSSQVNVKIQSREHIVKLEKAIKELERRMYNVEVKDQNCTCFCRKI